MLLTDGATTESKSLNTVSEALSHDRSRDTHSDIRAASVIAQRLLDSGIIIALNGDSRPHRDSQMTTETETEDALTNDPDAPYPELLYCGTPSYSYQYPGSVAQAESSDSIQSVTSFKIGPSEADFVAKLEECSASAVEQEQKDTSQETLKGDNDQTPTTSFSEETGGSGFVETHAKSSSSEGQRDVGDSGYETAETNTWTTQPKKTHKQQLVGPAGDASSVAYVAGTSQDTEVCLLGLSAKLSEFAREVQELAEEEEEDVPISKPVTASAPVPPSLSTSTYTDATSQPDQSYFHNSTRVLYRFSSFEVDSVSEDLDPGCLEGTQTESEAGHMTSSSHMTNSHITALFADTYRENEVRPAFILGILCTRWRTDAAARKFLVELPVEVRERYALHIPKGSPWNCVAL